MKKVFVLASVVVAFALVSCGETKTANNEVKEDTNKVEATGDTNSTVATPNDTLAKDTVTVK